MFANRPLTGHVIRGDLAIPEEGSGEFDDLVAALLCQNAGRFAGAAGAAFNHWRTSHSGVSFLDHLVERGVFDRLGARAVLLSWQGRLDGRDTRLLANSDAIGLALGQMSFSENERPEHSIGSRLGNYVIKGVLGRGGFGPVYLGVHPTLRVPVALKPVANASGPNGESLRDRLQAEAKIQATISHTNVVRVWDFEDADEPFLVLEYVHGEDLRCRLGAGPLTTPEAFTLLMHATLGLRAAHKVGVVHGDVKPSNLLVTPEGGFKLADFGLARSRRTYFRTTSAIAPRPRPSTSGSLNYMAPEQFEGNHDHRSDIYSLGLTLHHALAGVAPVTGVDAEAIMLRHKRGEIVPLHHVCPHVRREVSDLIRTMTAVDPDRRFAGYDDLLRAAEAAFGLRLEPY